MALGKNKLGDQITPKSDNKKTASKKNDKQLDKQKARQDVDKSSREPKQTLGFEDSGMRSAQSSAD